MTCNTYGLDLTLCVLQRVRQLNEEGREITVRSIAESFDTPQNADKRVMRNLKERIYTALHALARNKQIELVETQHPKLKVRRYTITVL